MNDIAATLFGLIRHAPTGWNEEKRIQGQYDASLSATGLLLAKQWGRELTGHEWDRILCSDLERTRKTAELINLALHLPVSSDPRLREQDWGDWAGTTIAALVKEYPGRVRAQERRGWDFRPPGGESRREVLQRSWQALLAASSAWPEEKILVVCHGGVIKCLLYHLLQRRFLPEEPELLRPYNLHLLTVQGDELSLTRLNAAQLSTDLAGEKM